MVYFFHLTTTIAVFCVFGLKILSRTSAIILDQLSENVSVRCLGKEKYTFCVA